MGRPSSAPDRSGGIGGLRRAAVFSPIAFLLIPMCVVPGGALREEALPPSRRPLQPGAAAFAALAPHPRLCGLDVQVRRSCVSEPRMAVRMVSPGERRRLPVAVSGRALQLRSAAAAQRRTALAMTEKENAETVEKSAEEIMALNLKLGDAAEAGDAELIRQLVEDGADVEYAPFVPDEDDDDEDDQDGDYSTNATEGSVEGTASVENPAPDVTVAGDVEKPKEETPEERKKRKKKEKQRKKKLAAANKGPSALHRACEKGHSDAACALVDLGADVNCLMHDLNTPLHLAVLSSRQDTVQVLVTLGADLKAKNQGGETPVALGQRCGTKTEVLDFLKQFEALNEPTQ